VELDYSDEAGGLIAGHGWEALDDAPAVAAS
jgi:hypothetical protein